MPLSLCLQSAFHFQYCFKIHLEPNTIPWVFRYILCKTVHKSLEYWLFLDTMLLFSNFLKCEALIFKRHSAPNLLPVFFSSAYLTLRWRCNIYCIHCGTRECSRGGCNRLCWVDWINVLQYKRKRKKPTTLKQKTPVSSVQFRRMINKFWLV